MKLLDPMPLDRIAGEYRGPFRSAHPYPHVVIDDFLPAALAADISAEFSLVEDQWKHYSHFNERKLALTDASRMPSQTQQLFADLQSREFLDFVGSLTGIEALIPDPELEGAGMHMTRPGGFLNIHTDFLTHTTRRSWRRKINMLIYLNEQWEEDWNGNLELWDPQMTHCVSSVAPIFNRCVIFNTLPRSYHGHPHRLTCPPERSRKSLAIYYYNDEGVAAALASTDYRPLPGDSLLKKALILSDRALLSLYTLAKGRFGLSDETASRLLRRLEGDRS